MKKKKKSRSPFFDAFYFVEDIEELIGVKRLTISRWCKKGSFPEPTKIAGHRLLWPKHIIDDWINEHILS